MVIFRQATPADLDGLVALLTEIMQHHHVRPPERERLVAILEKVLESTGHSLLLADSEGEIVGMCALIFSYSTWSASLACELQDVVVTASHRRRGIGRGLIDAADALARERGCSHLFLLAEVWNSGAHAFYRELGMAEKTCRDFERDLRSPADRGPTHP